MGSVAEMKRRRSVARSKQDVGRYVKKSDPPVRSMIFVCVLLLLLPSAISLGLWFGMMK